MTGSIAFRAILACALLWAGPALAQSVPTGFADAGQPTRWPAPSTQANVTGLGTARFGMGPEEVGAAIAADFGAEAAARLKPDDAQAGRTAIALSLPWLTDVAPATIAYVFESERLVQVNVSWAVAGDASDGQRAALAAVAANVTRNLYASFWQPFTATRGKPLGANAVVVFSGEDVMGGGVEVALFGVPYTVQKPDGSRAASPRASGEALLRISYAADIFGRNALRPGDF